MSLGGWGWVFRVLSLNSREAARRPLPIYILKRATPTKKNRTKVTGNTDTSRVRASIICRNEGDSHAGEVLRSNPETQVIVVPFFGSRKPSGNSGTKSTYYIGFPSHMQLFVVDDDLLDRLCCLSLNHRTANHSGGATIFRTFPGT